MRKLALAFLIVLTGFDGVNAEDLNSGNGVTPGCRAWIANTQTTFIQGFCTGRVIGVWEAARIGGLVCSPEEVTNGQAIRVVVQYIDARPARSHEQFAFLALEAIQAAWPCK